MARKMLLLGLALGLMGGVGEATPPQGCGVEKVSSLRLALPVSGASRVSDLHLAVDERGAFYVAFSSWSGGDRRRRLHLVSYGSNGTRIRTFERPSLLPEEAEWARITSLAYGRGRLYAVAQWREERWRSVLLIFDVSGDFRGAVTLDEWISVRLFPHPEGVYVVGVRSGSDGEKGAIWTLSADGEVLSTSSLPSPVAPNDHLIVDGRGRRVVLSAEGELRGIVPDGMARMLIGRRDVIHAAFFADQVLIVNRIDRAAHRMSLLMVDDRGVVCEVETTGHLSPMLRGADGYLYGFGQIGIRSSGPAEPREVLVEKFTLARTT